MSESPFTPFIPPLPGPEGNSPLRPPVIPSPGGGNPPAWATSYPNTPAHYPAAYPGTPYTGTPFIPPMNGMPTPGAQHASMPGSYFPPPINLPNGAPMQNAQGFHSDFTGYPNLAGGGTPWGPPPAVPPQTPFLHPNAAAYMSAGGPPPGMNMGGPVIPGGGGGSWGPQYGGPQYGGPQYGATPFMAGYGAPPPWAQTPGWGAGGPPLGPEPPAPTLAASRWIGSRDHWDKVDRFAEGAHYGPVLEPFLINAVRAVVNPNPLIEPPLDSGDREYLIWDMLFSSSLCRRSAGDPRNRSWSKGRKAPATFPRVTHVRIVSRAFPWMINIRARNKAEGVTCGEVIDGIDDYLHGFVPKPELKAASKSHQDQIARAYHYNRSPVEGVPGGRLGEGMKRCDWLCKNTMYGGIVRNDRFVQEQCGGNLPCTFELKCTTRFGLSREELEDLEEEERREAESNSGSRSRGSRSRATSSAGRSSGRSSGRGGE